METTHRVVVDDARSLSALEDDSVDLVVTSPPYPMIEMWDDLFTTLEPAIGDALEAGDGQAAFDAMHAELEAVWDELERVVVDGGIVCLNVGDATRSLDDSFRVYPNHARVLEAFEARGFDPLPDVLWRKPTNSAAKFMGSGMIPPNAYVTLEHEYILIFRNGGDSVSSSPVLIDATKRPTSGRSAIAGSPTSGPTFRANCRTSISTSRMQPTCASDPQPTPSKFPTGCAVCTRPMVTPSSIPSGGPGRRHSPRCVPGETRSATNSNRRFLSLRRERGRHTGTIAVGRPSATGAPQGVRQPAPRRGLRPRVRCRTL